jgi:hypothetical protein
VRQNRLIGVLDAVGSALILQLTFLLFSIPVVTIFGAAVALQRQLVALRAGEKTGVGGFFGEFRTVWRSSWPIGIALPIVVVGFDIALPFWIAVPAPLGWIGAGALAFVLGLAAGFYLSLLRIAQTSRPTTVAAWLSAAWAQLVLHGLRMLWGVILLACWLAFERQFLVIAPIGAGLVPALIVMLTLGDRRRAPAQV